MKTLLWAALAQAVIANPPTPTEVSPAVEQLEALSEWDLYQDQYGCRAQRTFGEDDRPTILEFRRDEPSSGRFDIAITSYAYTVAEGSFSATLLPNGIAYTPPLPGREMTASGQLWIVWDHDIREASSQNFSSKEWDRYLAEDGPEQFRRSVETLEIQNLFDRDIQLPIGPIDILRAQLDECYDSVVMAHGLTADDASDDGRPVEFSNRAAVLRSMIGLLPPALTERVQRQKQIDVNFVIFVDDEAKPVACRLTTIPRYHKLEKEGCQRIIEEGRFRFRKGEVHRPAIVQAGYFYRDDIGFRFTGR